MAILQKKNSFDKSIAIKTTKTVFIYRRRIEKILYIKKPKCILTFLTVFSLCIKYLYVM